MGKIKVIYKNKFRVTTLSVPRNVFHSPKRSTEFKSNKSLNVFKTGI